MCSSLRVLLVLLGSTSSLGCGASAVPVRVLSSEPPPALVPEAAPNEALPAPPPSDTAPVPRIGAPGGSGSGSRRVAPAQSGNETVGGLPAGIGGGKGPAGLG
jgi:hypothetical protein